MAGLVAARAPWREDRSPSHLSDSTRVSSDPPRGHPAARDDDDPTTTIRPHFPRLKICSRRCVWRPTRWRGTRPRASASRRWWTTAPSSSPRRTIGRASRSSRFTSASGGASSTATPATTTTTTRQCSRKKEHRRGQRRRCRSRRAQSTSTSSPASPPSSPTFHGILVVDPSTSSPSRETTRAAAAREAASRGQRAVFLRLEDVTAGFRKPCVIDLKVGLRTSSERGHDSAYVASAARTTGAAGSSRWGSRCAACRRGNDPPAERMGEGDGGRRRKNDGKRGLGKTEVLPRLDASSPAKVKRLRQVRSEGGRWMDPDGWVRNTRPYSWARGLCTKEDATRAGGVRRPRVSEQNR